MNGGMGGGGIPGFGADGVPGFGGGLTYGALLVRWGQRTHPLGVSTADFPPADRTALEMVGAIRAEKSPHGRSHAGLSAPQFAEARPAAQA